MAAEHPFVPSWVKDAVFYQIFPERFANGDTGNDPPGTRPWGEKPSGSNFFGGDLRGIIDRLDYLSSLGVNALYLTPIFSSTSNHKYDTADYLKIDRHLGTEKMFRTLVAKCHRRGMRLILDGVFNHTGIDFFAFSDIRRNGARSKYLGWYNIHTLPLAPPGKPNYECWWGIGTLPKLMTSNPDVRRYLFKVTRHWLDLGIDGWRLDVPNEIPHEFWREWRAVVKKANPEAYIVGEISGDGSPWLRGDQFDAVMNYRFRDACVDFFGRRASRVSEFDAALARQRADYPDEVNFALQNLLGSHDTERFLTVSGGDTRSVQAAVLFQMTYPGAPMVYYGDEVGLEGGKDPDCRRTMQWNPRRQNRELFRTHRRAIAMRKAYPVLRHGSFQTLLIDDPKAIYVFAREAGGATAVVFLNRGSRAARIRVPLGPLARASRWRRIWPVESGNVAVGNQTIRETVPAMSGTVLLGTM